MIKKWLQGHKIAVFLTICLLLCAVAFACYRSMQKKVLFIGTYAGSSWDVPSGQEYQFLDDVIKRFEKAHPNVDVKYESGVSKEDYSSWLSGKIVEGSQPDVFILPENDFNLLASTGTLAALDQRVKTDLNRSDFYPSTFKAGQYSNKQYALPFESNPVMMCINNDLLEKEGIALPTSGWTVEDFYKICKKLTKDTDGDGVIDQYGSVGYGWEEAVAAYGLDLFNDLGTKAYFNTPKMRSALSLVNQLTELNGNYKVTLNDFDEGKVAFYPMTLAQYRTYKPYPYHVSKYSSFSWTCVEMPSADAAKSRTQVSTSLYAISSKSAHSDLAWEFLKLLCADTKTQQTLFEKSQGVSVLKSVMKTDNTKTLLQNDSFGAAALTVDTLNNIMQRTSSMPKFKNHSSLQEKANYLISQSLERGTIENDLSAIQKDLTDSLDRGLP